MNSFISREIEIMDGEFVVFKFTWDEQKSKRNVEKGRPSFEEFVDLFTENYSSTIQRDSPKENTEDRQEILLIDKNGKKWKMVFVVRNHIVRVITCHRK